MSLPAQLQYLDILLGAILLLFGVRGFLRGFFAEIIGIAGLIAGILLANVWYPAVGEKLLFLIPNAWWANTAAYGLIVLATMLVITLATHFFEKLLKAIYLNWVNRLGGLIVGSLKGFLICAVLVAALDTFWINHALVQTSVMVPYVRQGTVTLTQWLPKNITLPQSKEYN